jgi:hypothetical protein
MHEGKSPLGKPRAYPVSLSPAEPHLVRLSLFGFGLSELGVGDRIGTIEEGKLADLVLINGNPLQDIETLRDVEMVFKEGRIVYKHLP